MTILRKTSCTSSGKHHATPTQRTLNINSGSRCFPAARSCTGRRSRRPCPVRRSGAGGRANSAPLSCVTLTRAPAGSGGHRQLCPDAPVGGLVGHDPGHEEPGLALDLGVRVASGADHAVGLPMAEPAPVGGRLRPFGYGHAVRQREPRHPSAVAFVAARQASRPCSIRTGFRVGVNRFRSR